MLLWTWLLFFICRLVDSQSLENVFGSLPPVSLFRDEGASAAYLELRKDCRYPLELLILQESTEAFNDDFNEMQKHQVPSMMEAISDSHPNSTFSVAFFTDKPVTPYGQATDFCQRLNNFTVDRNVVTSLYSAQNLGGGGDRLQNNLGALMAVAESRDVGWGKNEAATKLIVHVTDSAPHFYDGFDSVGLKVPQGRFDEDRAEEQCSAEYYPAPSQVRASLNRLSNLYIAHLIYDSEYLQGEVAQSWIWFNRYHGQTDDFVNLRERDSSDFWHKLNSIITKIDQLECRANRTIALQRTNVDCSPKSSYCKDGVSVQLGFTPDTLDVEVRP